MKVDKDNYRHWLILMLSAANIFFSMPFRLFKSRRKKRVVFFYQMHGNIQPLVEYIKKKNNNIEMYFLAFPEYLKIYEGKQPLPTLNMLNPLDMIKVAQCDVLITNYGALTLVYYARFTGIKFVDVWHGLPMLKNQTPRIMNYLNHYAEVWVSSRAMKKFYKERYRLRTKLIVTGYGRVDRLLSHGYDTAKMRKKYGLPDKKIILVAPTWKHNNPERSIFPFGMSAVQFFNKLNDLARRTNSFVVFRAHMLSAGGVNAGKLTNIKALPSNEYPYTEELLSVADMVITDWSSLVFDFMVTDKPVIFLDGETPFTGDELTTRSTPSNRFGPIVKSAQEFEATVKKYVNNPAAYRHDFADIIQKTKRVAHGNTLDGHATERYYKQLKKLLN